MALRKEIEAFLDANLSEDGRRDMFIAIAGEQILAFEEGWRAAFGEEAEFEHFVDGRSSGDPYEVQIPGGFVSERVVAAGAILKRAVELIDRLTKVVTGDYKSQTKIFRNDVEFAQTAGALSDQDLIVIGNIAPFARKAEQNRFNIVGDARLGLFETVAAMLKKEFRAAPTPIYFTYRALAGDPDDRVPIIAIGEGATGAGKSAPGRATGGARRRSFAAAYAMKKGR